MTDLFDTTAIRAQMEALDGCHENVRAWSYYPIEMPLDAQGNGPAKIGEDAVTMTYEVWDRLLVSYASYSNLPDAVNDAITRNGTVAAMRSTILALCDAQDSLCNALDEARAENERLRAALTVMVYETTHLSAEEADGRHWCWISKEALTQARAALAQKEEG